MEPTGTRQNPFAIDHSGAFKPTRWSLILKATDDGNPRGAAAALDELCRNYWYPLFCFARRRGLAVADAEDATQGFFARIIESEIFACADPAKGRLRTFLLTTFQRFLIDCDKHRFALKRGGPADPLSLDTVEQGAALDPKDDRTPEKLFEQQWAVAVLSNTLTLLEREWENQGRLNDFSILRSFLTYDCEESAQTYEAVAKSLGMTPGAARVSVCRLRKRFREVLKAHIAETLRDPSASTIEEEMRALYSALG